MRGWACHIQLLLVFTSALIFGLQSRGAHDHIILPQIQDSRDLKGQVPLFISARNRAALLFSQALVPFSLVKLKSCWFLVYRLCFIWTKQGTPLLRIPPFFSYVLSGLLPSDGPGIVDEGVCFDCLGNVISGLC
jgi:hypothetical protein